MGAMAPFGPPGSTITEFFFSIHHGGHRRELHLRGLLRGHHPDRVVPKGAPPCQGHHRLFRGTIGLAKAPQVCKGHHRPARGTRGLPEAPSASQRHLRPVRGTTDLWGHFRLVRGTTVLMGKDWVQKMCTTVQKMCIRWNKPRIWQSALLGHGENVSTCGLWGEWYLSLTALRKYLR